eukprot:TRINITY_DN35612_c0_g1_i1.p2 TRINITY_DN35612_c0_g1~~TRINITY_DN35612_c0_g1_i1.p2  ORF type:complete len:173 (+),score=5.60 TRINITY_DN35612_c0_g1_i1:296-814(+)
MGTPRTSSPSSSHPSARLRGFVSTPTTDASFSFTTPKTHSRHVTSPAKRLLPRSVLGNLAKEHATPPRDVITLSDTPVQPPYESWSRLVDGCEQEGWRVAADAAAPRGAAPCMRFRVDHHGMRDGGAGNNKRGNTLHHGRAAADEVRAASRVYLYIVTPEVFERRQQGPETW